MSAFEMAVDAAPRQDSAAAEIEGEIEGAREEAVAFDCAGERLVGVLTRPRGACHSTGVVIVVGGPQYRAGSHRHFVELARALAQKGWPTLRFDVRGMGDSSGAPRGFEQITPDIGAAIDALLQNSPGMAKVVLWGLCDAASAALLYADERDDARVAGLVLLNPWVRAAQTYARAQVRQYYARRLASAELWRGLLAGKVGLASVRDFAKAAALALRRTAAGGKQAGPLPYQARMARGWLRFQGPSLLVLSGRDLTAREFVERCQTDPALAGACARALVTTQPLPDADHTLSQSAQAAAHLEHLVEWLSQRWGEAQRAAVRPG